MSAILNFYDVYIFETYMNGFLDLEYPNLETWLSISGSRSSLVFIAIHSNVDDTEL